MKNQFLYLIIFALISNVIYSQSGELSGKIMDKEYNDILPFANVIVKETGAGTTTDFEGN
ncbi:carboxypeptidase-like regulatory domain-containing protein, partial [Lutimonas sp.]|uniref:carboxypeptidase-like regulatory domain-containing protein n=1 Tax=Lutimonas sp. TaxID=1872403 RepID=UPI003C74E2A7